jgi:hypothetical protein
MAATLKTFGEKVTKNNFQLVLKQRWRSLSVVESQLLRSIAPQQPVAVEVLANNIYQDWGEAIDVNLFYGRAVELATLNQWVVADRCRLVVLLGWVGLVKQLCL